MAIELVIAILFMLGAPSITDSTEYPADSTGSLVFQIKGLKDLKGKVFVKLYASEAAFLNESHLIQSGVPSSTGEITITFNNIPYGEYGASIFHDKNGNEKLDRGMFGIPKEPYAFSNNAKGRRGPASYQDSKFHFSDESKNQRIYLGRYKSPRSNGS